MKKAAYRKPYDEEFKRQAVELVISSGKSCEQVARELGVSGYSLHLWKKKHLARGGPGPGGRSNVERDRNGARDPRAP
jgi:transposase